MYIYIYLKKIHPAGYPQGYHTEKGKGKRGGSRNRKGKLLVRQKPFNLARY
jgi:hypothetical protein